MAFLGMLGHLAHPVTTPVWGNDKCSFTPRPHTQAGQRTHVQPYGQPTQDMAVMNPTFLGDWFHWVWPEESSINTC